jgi:hypothetical protein
MPDSSTGQGPWLFTGTPEQLQTLSNWLDAFNRAAYSHATDGAGSEEFLIDMRAINKALASGNEVLGCLNIVEAQKCSAWIGELQRDVAILLAGGPSGFLPGVEEPLAEQQQAGSRLQGTLRVAMPYFHWLGVSVRDRMKDQGETAKADQGSTGGQPAAKGKQKASINARMIDTLQKQPEAKDWTVEQWMQHLGCKSKASVAKTKCWETIMGARAVRKVQRLQQDQKRTR